MTLADEEFEQACQFIIELGTLGHRYGLTSSYLESYLSRFPNELGFSGHVLATPQWLDFIFWRTGDQPQHQYRYFKPLPTASYNLSKLASLSQLLHQFRQGYLSLDESLTRLQKIDRQAPPYGIAMVGLGYLLAGMGFAVLLSAADVALGGLLSLVVYGLILQADRWPWLAGRLEVILAMVAAVLANSLALLVFPGSNAFIVTLCAVVVPIPGLALTLGVGEIIAKNILSGTSRLIDGIVVTLKLYLGAALGAAIVNAIHPVPAAVPAPTLSAGMQWLSVLVLIFGIGLVFQVRPRDLGYAVLAGVLAYGGSVMGAIANISVKVPIKIVLKGLR